MLGITVHYSCDYWDLDPWHHRFCDQGRFKEELLKYKGQNALILHAGGNFNNFYKPQADRVMAVKEFTGTPVKSFGQTIEMDNGPGTKETVDTFNQHGDVMLAARDRNSYEWLLEAFPKSDMAAIDGSNGVRSILTPDVAFMIGNRPDIRLNTKKT
jgi:exopolysaccharide biosynthesis predicted pyruvyltransferase EpsI